jgi:hypothetical protein
MGARRAQFVVTLQAALMRAVGDFGADERFGAHANRALAAAAALDYVLMLATGTAGVRIAHDDAERAMHEGMARAVDELLASAQAIAELDTPEAHAFVRETARALREIVRDEGLVNDERSFALIALANA